MGSQSTIAQSSIFDSESLHKFPGVSNADLEVLDPLLSRGYMGDGVVDFATIGTSVRDAGYTGDIEVEIFNQDIWDTDGNTVLSTVKERYAELVLPYA